MGEAHSGAPGHDVFHSGPQFQRERSEAWHGNKIDTAPQACIAPKTEVHTVFPRNTVGGREVRAKEPGTASDD